MGRKHQVIIFILFVITFSRNPGCLGGEEDGTSKNGVGDSIDETSASETNSALSKIIKQATDNQSNTSPSNVTEEVEKPPTTTEENKKSPADLPAKGEAEIEHRNSMTIFFILLVVAICILMTHLLIQTKFHYLPESITVVLVGAFIGLVLKVFKFGNWSKEEAFSPTVFFIVLLPPIIFESGYNLHKGNFFQNIGTILVFAILGTGISAMVVGGGIYLLGQADVAYKFTVVESFAFGSLISAVDPVATLAIFHSLNVDEVLYMLVFGESILNDAVAITLTITVLEFENPQVDVTGSAAFLHAVFRFLVMFFGSSLIGMFSGLVSALLLKFVDLRKTPSLEIGMMLVFSYLPYGLAEGVHLSGIMAILMSGIVMSHYTHHNLSPVAQITVQHVFRTIAFIAETCVFAYIGMAFFSFKLVFEPSLTIWSISLILIGRAVNIFPLSFISNYFREHKITKKQQFIMWFSGLRGAIAFALSLHLDFSTNEKRYVIVTTTLIIVLFTILFLGGATMPLMKLLNAEKKEKKTKKKKKQQREISLSKTKEMGDTVDSEHFSEITESESEVAFSKPRQKGFVKIDALYLKPFFTRRFTQQEVRDAKIQMDHLTKQWTNDVRAEPSETEDETDEEETLFINSRNGDNHSQREPLMR